MYYSASCASPLGTLTMACDEAGRLAGLWIDGQKHFLDTLPEPPVPREDMPVFAAARRWLDAYFAGGRPDPAAVVMAPVGGAFRQAVWKILRGIPYGAVTTYSEIAREIARCRGIKTMSSQAVGGAVGHNPISILIPCHRVVGTNGNLTGYAGGIEKKVWLLNHEGVDCTRFSMPKQ